MNFDEVLIIITTLLVALHAGLLYAFTVAVVPGLRASRAKAHLDVMNQINIKIENPAFFISFMGPVVLLPITAFLFTESDAFSLIIAALILQLFLCYGATIAGNLPLNRQLKDRLKSDVSSEKAEQLRRDFQKPYSRWMQFHSVRTISSIIATALLLIALIEL